MYSEYIHNLWIRVLSPGITVISSLNNEMDKQYAIPGRKKLGKEIEMEICITRFNKKDNNINSFVQCDSVFVINILLHLHPCRYLCAHHLLHRSLTHFLLLFLPLFV